MTIKAICSFRRKYFYSMGESNGKFRGKGTITINDESIRLQGKRVYPLPYRLFLILLIAIAPSIIFRTYPFFLLLLLISSVLVEYFLLKEENVTLTWEEIKTYEIAAKGKTIAFSVGGNSALSPVVFQSQEFESIASAFREKVPEHERTAKGFQALEQRYDDQINSAAKFFDRLFK
jgi:hypothetical protein